MNPQFNLSWNRIITGGWNTAYTAEAYAIIGGYNPYMTKGEDMIMGERFSMARGDGNLPNTEVISTVSTRSNSSPRRYIFEVAAGKAAYGPDFEDPAVNVRIRALSIDQMLEDPVIKQYERINPGVNTGQIELMLNNEYGFVKSTTPNEAEAKKVMSRILLFLGFKPEDKTNNTPAEFSFTPDGKIVVNNWLNVKQVLDAYRLRHTTP